MSQISQLEQKMQEMQNDIKKMKELEKQKKALQYQGPNIKIRLLISNKEYITSAYTLLSKMHGNTLFIQQYTMDQNKNKTNNQQQQQPGSTKSDLYTLFFDRNPDNFIIILDYLRSYDIKPRLDKLDIPSLEKLKNDVVFYMMRDLQKIINNKLCTRFNPRFQSTLIKLSRNGTVATRLSVSVSLHVSVAVYGILEEHGSRYVEYNIMSKLISIMIGVTQARPCKLGPYPGVTGTSGCSLYGANGHLYRSGANEGWSAVWRYGDKIGVLVKLNKDNNTATITFYHNGVIVKRELNLKTYMDVSKGVMFTVNMYAATEEVEIVQNPIIPN